MIKAQSGAGIIFYHVDKDNKYYILLGQESKYMTDLFNGDSLEEFKRLQIYNSPTYEDTFYHIFETAKKIAAPSGAASPVIRFDTPHSHIGRTSGRPIFTTHMRYLPSGAKWGIVKGRSNKGEKPYETILREFEEEVGYSLERSGIVDFIKLSSNTIFVSSTLHQAMIKLTDGKMTDKTEEEAVEQVYMNINNVIAENNTYQYGELYNLHFVDTDTILKMFENCELNQISANALLIFCKERGLWPKDTPDYICKEIHAAPASAAAAAPSPVAAAAAAAAAGAGGTDRSISGHIRRRPNNATNTHYSVKRGRHNNNANNTNEATGGGKHRTKRKYRSQKSKHGASHKIEA